MDEQVAESSPKSSSKLLPVIVVVVLIVLATGAYFFYKHSHTTLSSITQAPMQKMDMTPQPSPRLTEEQKTQDATGTATTTTEKTFTITGQNFSFTPNTISVNKGDKVTIVFKNIGGFHNFTLDGYNVKTPTIQTGNSATVSFVADKTGTFAFYCSIANHRQMGMAGTLTVK